MSEPETGRGKAGRQDSRKAWGGSWWHVGLQGQRGEPWALRNCYRAHGNHRSVWASAKHHLVYNLSPVTEEWRRVLWTHLETAGLGEAVMAGHGRDEETARMSHLGGRIC